MAINKTALSLALSSAFAASLTISPVVNAAQNPFAMQSLDTGYMVAEAGEKAKDGKCGEGKCGGTKDAKEAKDGKCGEGKCGGTKDAKKAKDAKAKDGKCGEGKCGGTKAKTEAN